MIAISSCVKSFHSAEKCVLCRNASVSTEKVKVVIFCLLDRPQLIFQTTQGGGGNEAQMRPRTLTFAGGMSHKNVRCSVFAVAVGHMSCWKSMMGRNPGENDVSDISGD